MGNGGDRLVPVGERRTLRTQTEDTMSRWAGIISATPPVLRFMFPLTLWALVAALDVATGNEISFSIFYLLPVSFAAGFLSRGAAQAMAILSAGAWGYFDVITGPGYSAAWIPYWNSGVRLAFFLLVTELIIGLSETHARERALSRTDSLTGIPNLRVFYEHANRILAECRRSGRAFTITYLDLDHFKAVNDQFGHAEGDRVLRTVAASIADSLRETDVVARLGGDEFGILMPETGAEEALFTLERIVASLERDVAGRWSVGATFGAVTYSEPPRDVDCAVRQADALMYRGKDAGRGSILQEIWPASGVACS